MLTNLSDFKKYQILSITLTIRTDHGFENTLRLSYLKKIN